MVRGGKDYPCEPPEVLELIKADTGEPCPRVELRRENSDAAQLVSMVLDEYRRPFVPLLMQAMLSGRGESEARTLVNRVMYALSSPGAKNKLYPRAEKKTETRPV